MWGSSTEAKSKLASEDFLHPNSQEKLQEEELITYALLLFIKVNIEFHYTWENFRIALPL